MIRGVVYFALVFGIGIVLGTVRVLLLEPHLGERWAELTEMPFMLIAIAVSARFAVRKFPATRRASYIVSGGVGLILLILVECTLVVAVRGLTIAQYFAERDPIAIAAYVLMVIIFTAMPWFLAGNRRAA